MGNVTLTRNPQVPSPTRTMVNHSTPGVTEANYPSIWAHLGILCHTNDGNTVCNKVSLLTVG